MPSMRTRRMQHRLALAAALLATLAAASPAIAADYAPLDCGKAKSPTEKAICKSYALGQSEARMATLYAVATSLVAMGRRGELGDQQIAWLKTREACNSAMQCLSAAYAKRIDELQAVIADIASHGPF